AFWRQLPGDNILRRVLVRPHRESRRLVGDVIPRRKLIRTACLSNVVRALHAVGRLGQSMVTDVFVRSRLRQRLKVYRRVLLPVPTASSGPDPVHNPRKQLLDVARVPLWRGVLVDRYIADLTG